MSLEIVQGDITKMQVDAIVNTANRRPIVGEGADQAIHTAAGPQLLEARQKIGVIPSGGAAITPGFNLPSRYVIHTVGVHWNDGCHGELAILRSCYMSTLQLAVEHKCRSIAFPLLSSGNHGFPRQIALQVAQGVLQEFAASHEDGRTVITASPASNHEAVQVIIIPNGGEICVRSLHGTNGVFRRCESDRVPPQPNNRDKTVRSSGTARRRRAPKMGNL